MSNTAIISREGQASKPVPHIDGESLLSLVARTARQQGHESPYAILRAADYAYTAKTGAILSNTSKIGSLAKLLGISHADIASRMLHPSQTPGFVILNGVAVREQSLITSRRRFSSGRLRAGEVHLNAWMFHALPYCAESWEYLKDTCARCGKVQEWRHAYTLHRCDECSSDLRLHQATEVEAHLRPALSALAALISPDPKLRSSVIHSLPATLHDLDAGELLEVVVALARIIDPDIPAQFKALIDPSLQIRQVRVMAEAWEMLERLPHSVIELLVARKNDGKRIEKRFVHVSPILNCEVHDAYLPGTRRVLRTVLEELTTEDNDIPDGNIAVREAGRLLQSREELFVKARSDILTSRVSIKKGRVLIHLDRQEVESLAADVQDRITLYKTATRLWLPTYAVTQLVESGLLSACDHPWFAYRYGEIVLTNRAVADFEQRLQHAAAPTLRTAEVIRLDRAMTGFGGGPKPWSDVFRLLLDGKIAFEIMGGTTTKNILIRRSDAVVLRNLSVPMPLETYSQEDALEILNLSHKAGKHLLDVCESAENGEVGKIWTVPGNLVAELASKHVSYGEIMARTGLSAKAIETTLVKAGLKAPSGFGWVREEVEANGWKLLS